MPSWKRIIDERNKTLDDVAMGNTVFSDNETAKQLERVGLIEHRSATWIHPQPWWVLTDKGREFWSKNL